LCLVEFITFYFTVTWGQYSQNFLRIIFVLFKQCHNKKIGIQKAIFEKKVNLNNILLKYEKKSFKIYLIV
jgi:hypothetical protein